MKRLYFLLSLLILATQSIAQTRVTAPSYANPNYVPSPFCQAGQMLNIANAYTGTLQSDTVTTSSSAKTIYLYTSISGNNVSPQILPVAAVDTFVPYPLYGTGSITFSIYGTKISGTPNGTVTLQQSTDGINWVPTRASTTAGQDTLNMTTNTALTYSFDKTVKYAPYYRLAIVFPSGTQSSIWQASYFFQPDHSSITNH